MLPSASRGALAGVLGAALLVAALAGFAAPAAADGGSDAITYLVDGDERSPPEDDPVFRNQTVTATGLDDGTDYDLRPFDPDGGTAGEPLDGVAKTDPATATIDTGDVAGEPLSPGWYVVTEDDRSAEVAERRENAFRLAEEELSAGVESGTVDSTGDGARTNLTVDSNRAGSLDVRVTAQGLDGDELYVLFRGQENAAVERGDGAVVVRGLDPAASVPLDFEPVHPSSYELSVAATDTGAADVARVEVRERELDAAFGKTVYEADVGDFVAFDVSFQGTAEGYVLVGGDRVGPDGHLTNFVDVLHVGDGARVAVNTRLLGSDAPGDEVYVSRSPVASYAHSPDHPAFEDLEFTDPSGDPVAADLASFRRELGISGPPRPLEEGRYRLLAGTGDVVVREDGVPDFEHPLARSNLFLGPPTFGNLTTYVAPQGTASGTDSPAALRSSLTERPTVTKGDRLVLEFEATGFHGTLSWIAPGADPLAGGGTLPPSTLAALVDLPAGFTVEAVQRDPGRNEERTELDLAGAADGEAHVLAADATDGGDDARSTDTYYLVVDTRGAGPFDREPEPGETYEFEVGFRAGDGHYRFDRVDHDAKTARDAAVDHYPYLDPGGESVTWIRNVTVEAPALRWNRTDAAGRPIVLNRSDAAIEGWVNYAPGTDASAQLLPDNRTDRQPIAVQDVAIAEDGTFAIAHDLSGRPAGEPIGVEFYVRGRLFEKRAVRVVDSAADLPAFDVVDAPAELAVRENGSTTLSTDVHNPGTLAGRERVELRVDGAVVDARTFVVEPNETVTVAFDVRAGDLAAGTYNYSVVTPHDRLAGTLAVESTAGSAGDPDAPGYDATPSAGADPGDSTPTPGTPAGEAPAGDGGGPFGLPLPVGGRHAVGGAVIVGAVHVLEHWL